MATFPNFDSLQTYRFQFPDFLTMAMLTKEFQDLVQTSGDSQAGEA